MTEPLKPASQAAAKRFETTPDALVRLSDAFERYAGWLETDRTALAVRSHAHALREAQTTGAETSPWIHLLEVDLQRLPCGEVRKMLRRTLTEISAALDARYDEGLQERS